MKGVRIFLLSLVLCFGVLCARSPGWCETASAPGAYGPDITLQNLEEEERVLIRIPKKGFQVPMIEALAGSKPRIIIDVENVGQWNEIYKKVVRGSIIKKIRSYLHEDENRLRVVLDVRSSPRNYLITQTYDVEGEKILLIVSIASGPAKPAR